MYDDDLVIYCKEDEADAMEVVKCLRTYGDWTGQRINWDKSMVHFRQNVPMMVRKELCRLLSMSECNHKSLYLGTSFFPRRKQERNIQRGYGKT